MVTPIVPTRQENLCYMWQLISGEFLPYSPEHTLFDAIIKRCTDAVRRPGKFEGEQAYAYFYYHAYLEGDAEQINDDEENPIWQIQVQDFEAQVFPELLPIHHVYVFEDNNGFFYCLNHNPLHQNALEV